MLSFFQHQIIQIHVTQIYARNIPLDRTKILDRSDIAPLFSFGSQCIQRCIIVVPRFRTRGGGGDGLIWMVLLGRSVIVTWIAVCFSLAGFSNWACALWFSNIECSVSMVLGSWRNVLCWESCGNIYGELPNC
jgi:hypothetical protein